MPYRPQLRVTVEWGGASFEFVSPDDALGSIISKMLELGLLEWQPSDPMPPQLVPYLPRIFEDGCVAWQGVEDASGEPLPCTLENRKAIPYLDRVQIASLYFAELGEMQEGKVEPPATPTS